MIRMTFATHTFAVEFFLFAAVSAGKTLAAAKATMETTTTTATTTTQTTIGAATAAYATDTKAATAYWR